MRLRCFSGSLHISPLALTLWAFVLHSEVPKAHSEETYVECKEHVRTKVRFVPRHFDPKSQSKINSIRQSWEIACFWDVSGVLYRFLPPLQHVLELWETDYLDMPRVQTTINLHKSLFLSTGVSCTGCYVKQQKIKKVRVWGHGAGQVALAKARTFRRLAEREGFLWLVICA